MRTSHFASSIFLNGKTEIAAPPRHTVLGAGVCRYQGPDNAGQLVTKSYLVGVFCGSFYLDWAPHEEDLQCWDIATRPETVNPVFAYAALNTNSGNTTTPSSSIGPWHILHTENLHDRADVMPPINAMFFSASGTQCATCIPTLAEGRITHQYPDGGDTEEKSYQVGNDLILRARFVPTLTGVTLESITQENQTQQTSTYQTDYSKTGPADRDYGDWTFSNTSSESATSRAILSIDYVGDQEVTLEAAASSHQQSQQGGAGYSVEGSIEGDVGSIDGSSRQQTQVTLIDTYRQKTVGTLQVTASTSASESWAGSDPGGEGSIGSLGWTVSNGSTRQGSVWRPYYYDLRTGAGLWYTATASTQQTRGHSGDLAQGPSSWEGSESGHLSAAFEDANGRRYGQNTTSYANDLSGPVKGTPTLQGSGVSGSWSHSASGSPTRESGSNLARAQPLSRWQTGGYSWTPVLVMPIIYTQSCNRQGDIVCRIDFKACPKVDASLDSAYWMTAHSIDFSRVHHTQAAFSTAFDLDQVWMVHLTTYHQPADGSEIPLQTAFEGGVVPEFRR